MCWDRRDRELSALGLSEGKRCQRDEEPEKRLLKPLGLEGAANFGIIARVEPSAAPEPRTLLLHPQAEPGTSAQMCPMVRS